MSRLNNDVVGAQNAISNTIVGIVTNLVEAVAILVVMFTLEWRLTIVSLVILPLFILFARRLGTVLRDIARAGMELNAQMNAHMNETLNIGGALLVKLFGRSHEEEARFRQRAAGVRDIGVQQRGHRLRVLCDPGTGRRGRDGTRLRAGRILCHHGRLHRRHHRRLRIISEPAL